MADTYAQIAAADEAVQAKLADVLDLRATDLQQQAMLHDYLADVPLADGARALEIGCGTGWVSRTLARRSGVAEVVGIDPSPVFIERAQGHAAPGERVSFRVADGRDVGDGPLAGVHPRRAGSGRPRPLPGAAARAARA